MTHRDEMPEDVEPMADWLRAQRPDVSAQDLHRLKMRARMRARAQAESGPSAHRSPMRPRRVLATALTALALTVGLGGAFALAGGGPPFSGGSASSHGSAAKTQYKPGKGCGDTNHHHQREPTCTAPK